MPAVYGTQYPKKLALTSQTSSRRSWTQATEFFYLDTRRTECRRIIRWPLLLQIQPVPGAISPKNKKKTKKKHDRDIWSVAPAASIRVMWYQALVFLPTVAVSLQTSARLENGNSSASGQERKRANVSWASNPLHQCRDIPVWRTWETERLLLCSGVVKRPGREVDHSPPTSAEVRKTWIYPSTSPYVFLA
jgi:hypothetical protein